MLRRFLRPLKSAPLVSCGAFFVFLWLFLTAVSLGFDLDWLPDSWQAGFTYEVDNDAMPTVTFLAAYVIATFALGATVWTVCKRGISIGAWSVIVFAIAMRLIAMFGEPIHESDFYRYIWDGKSALVGVNPFQFEPGALILRETNTIRPFPDPDSGVTWQGRSFSPEENAELEKLEDLRLQNPEWFARISHKAVPTIYPPLAQLVFVGSAAVFGWSLFGLKLLILCFDVATICLILAILRRLGTNPAFALLYAWHPLVVKEFANSAHYDAVPIFFCVVALWIALSRPESLRRAVAIGFVLGLGALAKYFAVLLLPILLWRRWSDRNFWIGCLTFAATLFLGFLPFSMWSDVGWAQLFEGLRIYGEHWQYNPAAFAVFQRVFELAGDGTPFRHANWLCAVVLCGVVAWLTFRSRLRIEQKCFAAMGALFVLSPTAFPWYLCWALAFLPFQPRWSWLVLSLLIPLNYLDFKSEAAMPIAFAQLGGFYILSGTIWIVFVVCWFIENARVKSRCLDGANASP